MSYEIASVQGRRVWDSRGRPTVEAEIRLSGGAVGRAIAPAGASRGTHEAVDLRDGGERFGGMDVQRAVGHINEDIARAIVGFDAQDQAAIDATLIALDGTMNKARLGGNAIVAVSVALAQAAAASRGLPLWRYLAGSAPVSLPLPEIQVFGGGAHAGRRLDIQDVMVTPVGAGSCAEAIALCAEVYRATGALLEAKGQRLGVADEGGYWPVFESNEQALAMLMRGIERAGLTPGREIALSLDIAASELGRNGRYRFALEDKSFDSDALIELMSDWLNRYPIVSIEDPLGEDDRDGWLAITRALGERVQIIGDDLLTTDAGRVNAAARDGACNAVLIKPNQAGTLTETLAAVSAAKHARFGTIVSARSGETEDVAIAHLAVGWNVGQIKVGSLSRGERTAKWNELLRIEQAMGSVAQFSGIAPLRPLRAS